MRSLILTDPTSTNILKTSSPIYAHTCVTAAALVSTTGGDEANTEKIMQASKIWKVTARLDQVIDYATNPEKTAAKEYLPEQYQALADVLQYANLVFQS